MSSAIAAPAQLCPCCGQQVSMRVTPEAIIAQIHPGPVKKRILLVLLDRFGSWVPSAQLIEKVYSGAHDGGPVEAQQVMSVSVIKLRKYLIGSELVIDGKQWSGYRLRWAQVA